MMSEPLLKIQNRHSPECGDPPIVSGDDPDVYVGYFENSYGEQWIFTYDRKTGRAELRGGDVGWNDRFEVQDGTVPDLKLSREESMWLKACWIATGA